MEEIPIEIIKQIEETQIQQQINVVSYKEIQFGKLIGEGSFGTVYRGNLKGRNVAIKVIKFLSSKDNEKQLVQFLQELKIHSRLKDDRLLNLIAVSYDKQLCLITNFMEGGSLKQAIYQKKLYKDFKSQLLCFLEISEGILALHTSQPPLMHRDLKPANILLDQHGSLKIADFGLARMISTGQMTNVSNPNLGTLRYMSPECFQQTGKLGANVDI